MTGSVSLVLFPYKAARVIDLLFHHLDAGNYGDIPYRSKFPWHNIFVDFVINLEITKILFTK